MQQYKLCLSVIMSIYLTLSVYQKYVPSRESTILNSLVYADCVFDWCTDIIFIIKKSGTVCLWNMCRCKFKWINLDYGSKVVEVTNIFWKTIWTGCDTYVLCVIPVLHDKIWTPSDLIWTAEKKYNSLLLSFVFGLLFPAPSISMGLLDMFSIYWKQSPHIPHPTSQFLTLSCLSCCQDYSEVRAHKKKRERKNCM